MRCRPYKRLKAYDINEEMDVLRWKLTSEKKHACDGLHCVTPGKLGLYRCVFCSLSHPQALQIHALSAIGKEAVQARHDLAIARSSVCMGMPLLAPQEIVGLAAVSGMPRRYAPQSHAPLAGLHVRHPPHLTQTLNPCCCRHHAPASAPYYSKTMQCRLPNSGTVGVLLLSKVSVCVCVRPNAAWRQKSSKRSVHAWRATWSAGPAAAVRGGPV